MNKIAGVLGLQGAYEKHLQMLKLLGMESFIVRYPEEIKKCDGLVIPGGESSTISKLSEQMELRKPLADYQKPILATCAGVILMSENEPTDKVKPLNKIPLQCERNAYGRQIESFSADIKLEEDTDPFPAIFIRAPKISKITSDRVNVLAEFEDSPVLVQYKNIIAATFHPELSPDTRIHEKFINLL